MAFVPEKHKDESFPCRNIPLNAYGETLDSLYRSASQTQVETAVAEWLRRTIHEMEAAQTRRQAKSMGTS